MDARALGGILGLFAGMAMTPEEAEGAVRTDILDVVNSALKGGKYSGMSAGTLESENARNMLLTGNGKYKKNKGYLTHHGLTWRNINDGWEPEKISNAYKGIYNDAGTVVTPNVLGIEPAAKEALWNPTGLEAGKSLYMPIVPYKKGFKSISVYDPKASKVEELLRKRGYWDDGSDSSSIFTPTLEVGLVQPVGSGTLSAVSNQPSVNTTLQELLDKVKRGGSAGLAGTGAALYPEQTQSAQDSPKERTGGIMDLFRDAGSSLARGAGLDTRALLSGAGDMASLFVNTPVNAAANALGYHDVLPENSGSALADYFSLPKPESFGERLGSGAVSGLAGAALPLGAGAKMASASSPLARNVGKALAGSPMTDEITGGMFGILPEVWMEYWGGR